MTAEAPEITALRRLCRRIQDAWIECEDLNDQSTRDEYDRRYGYFNCLVDQISHDDVILLFREYDRLRGADYIHTESNMTATEMHDLLALAFAQIQTEGPLFRPGTHEGFTHIDYCRFCGFSTTHVGRHGHSDKCLYDRLERACSGDSAAAEQKCST